MGEVLMEQRSIDIANTAFWNHICGSNLWKSLGLTDYTREALHIFDTAYLEFYPYLKRYIKPNLIAGKQVLEIGFGNGVIGQHLLELGCEYYGIDIAPAAVNLMRNRLVFSGIGDKQRINQGSALELPYPANMFDAVYSIGCLHHTGNLPLAIQEVHRVLKRGGTAVIMVYNRHSFRRLIMLPWAFALAHLSGKHTPSWSEFVKAAYDGIPLGPPHTEFVSRTQAKHLFRKFQQVRIERQNFDNLSFGFFGYGRFVNRKHLLDTPLARFAGLDLYIVGKK